MKKLFTKLSLVVGLAIFATSCEKKKEIDPADDGREFRFIRLMVSDEKTNQITMVDAKEGVVQTFEAKFPKSAVYTTDAGRFGGIVHRDNNLVEHFDTGFEYHGDHVDVKGTPKFASLLGESLKPTHYKSQGDEIITFNDGDGSMSVAKETDLHKVGMKMQTIPTGNVAHHGAMAKFNNGNYAVTHKDGSIAGTLPERVKIIDKSGKLIAESTIQTKGIHGNNSDGKVALFGSASGILVIEESGKQRLIKYPETYGVAWFGTILHSASTDKFFGYSAALGFYEIDVKADKISPIFESKDIMQCKLNKGGNKVNILLFDGSLKVFDLKTRNLVKEGNIGITTTKEETQKPTLEATDRFAYIVLPKTGELQQFDLNTMSTLKKIKVSTTPYRVAILGSELNLKGDD